MGDHTPLDLVDLANQLALNPRWVPRKKNHENLNLLTLTNGGPYAKLKKRKTSQFLLLLQRAGILKRDGHELRCLQPSNQPFQCPTSSQWPGSEELLVRVPILLLNQFRETTLQIGNESLSVLIDTGAKLSVLDPSAIKQLLPWIIKTVQ